MRCSGGCLFYLLKIGFFFVSHVVVVVSISSSKLDKPFLDMMKGVVVKEGAIMMNLIKEDINGKNEDLSNEALRVLRICLEYSVSFLETHCLTSAPLVEFITMECSSFVCLFSF